MSAGHEGPRDFLAGAARLPVALPGANWAPLFARLQRYQEQSVAASRSKLIEKASGAELPIKVAEGGVTTLVFGDIGSVAAAANASIQLSRQLKGKIHLVQDEATQHAFMLLEDKGRFFGGFEIPDGVPLLLGSPLDDLKPTPPNKILVGKPEIIDEDTRAYVPVVIDRGDISGGQVVLLYDSAAGVVYAEHTAMGSRTILTEPQAAEEITPPRRRFPFRIWRSGASR